jgi:hypothetical protein
MTETNQEHCAPALRCSACCYSVGQREPCGPPLCYCALFDRYRNPEDDLPCNRDVFVKKNPEHCAKIKASVKRARAKIKAGDFTEVAV